MTWWNAIFYHIQSTNFPKFLYRLKSATDLNPIEMIFALITMPASFVFILFICEFGEMASSQFDSFDEELWMCDWYTFPIEMQQFLMTFMSNTQQPGIFRGYGNTECTRETFKKVWTTSVLWNCCMIRKSVFEKSISSAPTKEGTTHISIWHLLMHIWNIICSCKNVA